MSCLMWILLSKREVLQKLQPSVQDSWKYLKDPGAIHQQTAKGRRVKDADSFLGDGDAPWKIVGSSGMPPQAQHIAATPAEDSFVDFQCP